MDINKRPMGGVNIESMRQQMSQIETPSQGKSKSKFKLTKTGKIFLVAVLLLVVLIILGFIFIPKKSNNKSEWQAVFLSNSEVYFGKVVSESAKDIILKDIYYLQEPQSLQQGSDISKQTGGFALIKLGNEIHGPYDEMRINNEHILYIEDLKDDSKVVRAIMEHEGK